MILSSLMSKCQLEFRGCLVAIDKNPTELGFSKKKKKRERERGFIVSNNEQMSMGNRFRQVWIWVLKHCQESIYLHSSALLSSV